MHRLEWLAIGDDGARSPYAEGEGNGSRVGGADAAISERAGPADPRTEVGRGLEACSATSAAVVHAWVSETPAAVCSSSVSTNGTSASSIVLSPTLALPSAVIASRPARMAAASWTPVISSASSPSVAPTADSAAPHNTPEVPPALAAQASPARLSTVATPAPSSTAAAAATRAAEEPLAIPRPWSPSPATASMRPSSSGRLIKGSGHGDQHGGCRGTAAP